LKLNDTMAAGLERGVWKTGLLAVAGLLGFLLATGQLAQGATQTHATVQLKATSVGKVLVGANGRTLYLFTHDKGAKSRCAGQCAAFWPPLTVTAKPVAGAGIKASMLGWTKRADGKMQVTYNHHPLYFFKLDKKSGQVNGEGFNHFGGLWWVVSAKGVAVKKSNAPATTTTTSTTPTTTTTSGGGGGYGSY
jgi:predicted lipoprotein with Yx(FWY)xxD motif